MSGNMHLGPIQPDRVAKVKDRRFSWKQAASPESRVATPTSEPSLHQGPIAAPPSATCARTVHSDVRAPAHAERASERASERAQASEADDPRCRRCCTADDAATGWRAAGACARCSVAVGAGLGRGAVRAGSIERISSTVSDREIHRMRIETSAHRDRPGCTSGYFRSAHSK